MKEADSQSGWILKGFETFTLGKSESVVCRM